MLEIRTFAFRISHAFRISDPISFGWGKRLDHSDQTGTSGTFDAFYVSTILK